MAECRRKRRLNDSDSSDSEIESIHSSTDDDRDSDTSDEDSNNFCLGSRMTTSEFHLRVMTFGFKHGLTKSGFDDLLELMKDAVPDSTCLSNYYSLKQFINQTYGAMDVVKQQYCGDCYKLLNSRIDPTQSSCCSGVVESFVTVPIAPQLKRMLDRS